MRGGARDRKIDHDVADLARAVCVVRRSSGQGDVRLGVVSLPEVLPGAPARLLPELPLEQVEELGATHFVAPAGPEDGAHQASHRDDVVPRPGRDRKTGLPVLRVDAGDVRVDDPDRKPPLAPCARSSVNCCARRASAAAPGRNRRPDSASAKALTPGASSAAMRPGPRKSSMISWRSAAVAQPAPKATFSAVVPLTCGTPHRSRVIVPPCGVARPSRPSRPAGARASHA